MDTVEHGEMVEKQLEAIIQRRARKGDVVDFVNITRQSIGPNRGDVEGALSYLAGLVNQYQEPAPEPAAVTEEAGAA